MRVLIAIAWLVSLLASVAGCGVLISGVAGATSAPQEAAAAGIALGVVIIPYCIARALSGLNENSRAMRNEKEPTGE